jgi:signal transduction histidine kinase
VALELAQVATSLPFAASLAMAGGITTLRERRRRTALNEAVHELRRPLQVLSLSLSTEAGSAERVGSSLRMTAAALERLEREINGEVLERAPAPFPLRPLIEAAAARWRVRGELGGGSLGLRWVAGDPWVLGDEVEVAQAVDNMISNAIEHGGGEVGIEAREDQGDFHLAVIDSGVGGDSKGRRRGTDLRARISGRRRHGHGLRVVERVAGSHSGCFELRRGPSGAEARLQLPLYRGASR